MDKDYMQDWLPDDEDDSLPTQVAPKRVVPGYSRVGLNSHKCHVIVVYSLSGGTGKTTIATNVAAALKREGERVLLIDCALQSGDVGIFLNLQSRFNLYDLLQNPDHLLPDIENPNPEFMDENLVKHENGLEVLLAPDPAQDIDVVSLVHLIERLWDSFNFIVIDTASNRDALNLTLLSLADHVLLIVNPTLPSVKNTHLVLEMFNGLAYDTKKVHLVFNQVDATLEHQRVTIPLSRIETHLQKRALGAIPRNNQRVISAINRGVTMIGGDVLISPAKELIALAEALYVLCKGAEVS